jgi:hypothetical protein
MSVFLVLLLVAVALGIIGVVAKGLMLLLVLGIVLFLADLVGFGFFGGRRRRRPAR